MLQNYYKYDIAVLPFYMNTKVEKKALVVVVRIADQLVDLFDRERATDSNYFLPKLYIDYQISDSVLHMMNIAADMHGHPFSEDDIDGAVEGVCADNDEDMLVATCYIAECLTFEKQIDLEQLNLQKER